MQGNEHNEGPNAAIEQISEDPLFAPLPGVMVEDVGVPLPSDHVEILFRHSRAASFTVGGFQFRDHILRIVGPREEVLKKREQFSQLVDGLLAYDRSAITQLRTPPTLAEQVSRRISGAVATNQVVDKQAIAAPVAAPKSSINFNMNR